MERIHHGTPQYRTQLMEQAAAFRFAKCVHANPQYRNVTVEESKTATDSQRRWFVAYEPTDPNRTLNLLQKKINQRLQRALDEGARYVWAVDTEQEYWHLVTPSGNTYEVDTSGESCSCEDHTFTCKPAGIRCKHLLAYDLGLGSYYTSDWQRFPAMGSGSAQ